MRFTKLVLLTYQMFLLYSSVITSKEIFAAIGLLSLSMVYMKFCNVWRTHNREIQHKLGNTMSELGDRTYCVNLVVFMFGIDVFNISHNVRVQSLQKEKRCC